MTYEPTKEDIEALVEALTKIADLDSLVWNVKYGENVTFHHQQIAKEALEKFKPKPAKVYVLWEWEWFRFKYPHYANEGVALIDSKDSLTISKATYERFRELTAIDAPEPAQKWNVPTWNELPLTNKSLIIEYTDRNGETCYMSLDRFEYESIRDKIMAMNDD